MTSEGRRHIATRTLLVCGALGALQALLSTGLSAFTPAVAAAFPPAYALLAAIHSLFPFLARIWTTTPWTATITSGITGVLLWPFSALGPLVLVALLAGSLAADLILRRADANGWARRAGAAAAAGAALFVISLPVFSPDHLTPGILIATLVARVLGELAAMLAAGALATALRRVGVRSR